jgi:molecular chaperone DnaK
MKELAEAKNTAEQVAYSTEKSLKEHESRLDDATRDDIRSKIDLVRQALEGDDAGEIRSRLEALREASFKLGEVVYQQAQQAQSGAAGDGPAQGSEPAGDEEIVDAEVVDESGDRA